MFFSRHKQKNCLSPQYVYWSSKRNESKQIDLRSKCDGRQTQDCQLQWYEREVARHLQKSKVKWSSMSRTSTGTQCLGAAAKSEFNSNKSIAKIWIKESGTKFFYSQLNQKPPLKILKKVDRKESESSTVSQKSLRISQYAFKSEYTGINTDVLNITLQGFEVFSSSLIRQT